MVAKRSIFCVGSLCDEALVVCECSQLLCGFSEDVKFGFDSFANWVSILVACLH